MKASKENNASNNLQLKETNSFFFKKNSEEAFFSDRMTPFGNKPFFSPHPVRPKLTIGQADGMADQMVQRLSDSNSLPAPTSLNPQNTSQTISSPPAAKVQQKESEEGLQEEMPEQEKGLQKKAVEDYDGRPPASYLQRNCAACTAEENGTVLPQIHARSIFESNEASPAEGQLQRKCAACQEGEIRPRRLQRKETGASLPASSGLESRLNTTKGVGQPLPEETRGSMESAFGTDFSSVRVHHDSRAVQMNRELGAQAFTYGSDIYFNSGKYDTASKGGQHLLAHELTHVVQQGGDNAGIQRYPATSDYRIRGIYERSAQHPTMIFFDFDSDVIPDSQEEGKVVSLSVPLTRTLRLVGKASEEGNAAYNRGLARRRARAVKDRLIRERHTGSKPITVASESGHGAINYKFKRQVEIIPEGEPERDPNCGANPDPRIPCSTFSEYSNFPTRLSNAKDHVDDGINALNEYTNAGTAQARRDAIAVLLRRFFGSDTTPHANTLKGNLSKLKSHLNTHVDPQHECHNFCDTSCAMGSTAYNSGRGAAARMVLCEKFFQGSARDQEETLIHESVHGMGPNRRPDRTYRWTRLFGTMSQELGIPTTQALNNPDHIVFFLREIRAPGSTGPNRIADDTFDSGMNATQQREAFLALAHMEWWLVRGRQVIGSFYRVAAERARNGNVTWGGSPGDWHVDILRAFNTHFGTIAYPRVPTLRDREVYAGISQRFRDMNFEVSRNRQAFQTASAGPVSWDRGAHRITLPDSFFGRPVVAQIKDLILALAKAEPTISDALAPEYPEFIDKVRRTDNVGP